MDKKYLLQITTELYHLTLLFPKKEPLRYKMRELADEILAALISFSHQHKYNDEGCLSVSNTDRPIEEKLEVLDSFFEVAKAQNWVSPAETLKLQQEYSKLKENLKTQANSNRKLVPATQFRNILRKELVASDLPRSGGGCGESSKENPKAIFTEKRVNERQKKILGILKEREKAQIWEIKKFFPEVAKRTLRRDFEFLLQKGVVEKIGERNDTFYKLKSSVRSLSVSDTDRRLIET